MRFLLDTHILLWSISQSTRLPARVLQVLADPTHDVFTSVVSLWEIAIKVRIGKLTIDDDALMATLAPPSKITLLAIAPAHLSTLRRLSTLPGHNDPFDHLLIAQAITERLVIVTHDQRVPGYPVEALMA